MKSQLSFVVVGCGSRGRTYMRIARKLGHTINAIADPSESAQKTMSGISENPEIKVFNSGEELLAEERMADVALISTQDSQHFGHASLALKAGYDVLLEKPAAQTQEETEQLAALAKEMNRKLILCFVLRYTPFFRTIKKVIDDGMIGDVITMQAHEGVEHFHHVHSYVRGHWAKQKESTPMIIAKCSHDTDILAWIAKSHATDISSYEDCLHFRPDKAPEGATERCTDGCPHVGTCLYDANRYYKDKRNWVRNVIPHGEDMTEEEILEWIKTSKWGLCAYKAGHDTPDHQVVSMKFENGITATLTMTAFDCGRRIRIFGTKGMLEGAIHADKKDPWVQVTIHDGDIEQIPLIEASDDGYASHGGGDYGLIDALPSLLEDDTADYIEGHRIGFVAAKLAEEVGRI